VWAKAFRRDIECGHVEQHTSYLRSYPQPPREQQIVGNHIHNFGSELNERNDDMRMTGENLPCHIVSGSMDSPFTALVLFGADLRACVDSTS
jgi:hypothetical protein